MLKVYLVVSDQYTREPGAYAATHSDTSIEGAFSSEAEACIFIKAQPHGNQFGPLRWRIQEVSVDAVKAGSIPRMSIDREVLERLEWITDEFTGCTGGRCRICGGYKLDRHLHPGEFAGHSSDCKLGNALKEKIT